MVMTIARPQGLFRPMTSPQDSLEQLEKKGDKQVTKLLNVEVISQCAPSFFMRLSYLLLLLLETKIEELNE